MLIGKARMPAGPLRTAAIAAISGLVMLAMPGLASATPTVTAKARILPIPGFPHTGDCLGCGAELEAEATITGSEYAGGPAPVTEVKVYFPKGTKIHTAGFPTCSASAVERGGVAACPKGSRAGQGQAQGFVSLGGERVPETTSVDPFFVPGGVDFWIEGDTPVKIEKLATGSWSFPSSGPVITVHVPLIETLPGAPDASATHIEGKSGGAIRKGGKTLYYGTVPDSCPAGGFPGKAEITFLEQGTVTVDVKVPCPPGSAKRHASVKRHGKAQRHGAGNGHSVQHGKAKGHQKPKHCGKAKGSSSKPKHCGKAKGHSKGPTSLY
jgi:hypothetical protein